MSAPKAQNWAPGDQIELTAGQAYTAGTPYSIAGRAGIPDNDIADGDLGTMRVRGHFKIAGTSATGSAGDLVWYDNDGDPVGGTAGSGAATTSEAAGDILLGTLVADKAATDTHAIVDLNRFTNDQVLSEISNIALGDNDDVVFGDGSDVALGWDGSALNLLPTADDTGAFNIGDGTTDFDVKVFLGSTAAYALFDVGNALVDFHAPITVGEDDAGHDVKFFGATAGSYLLWDESEDRLELDGADLNLQDSDVLQFGDAQDITVTWDGTQLVVGQAAADSAVHFGADDAGIDLKLFGDTAGSYLLWDQSADKLIINAGSADLGTTCEADAYTVGGSAGVDFGPAAPASLTVVKGIVTAASS